MITKTLETKPFLLETYRYRMPPFSKLQPSCGRALPIIAQQRWRVVTIALADNGRSRKNSSKFSSSAVSRLSIISKVRRSRKAVLITNGAS